MNFSKKKIILFSILISTFLISSTFTTIKVLGYDWNETQTFTLQEDDNTGYGVFDGRRIRENQYLEAEYATDIRYVNLDSDSSTVSMANDSTVFRGSWQSSYYGNFRGFNYESSEWMDYPTYIQASNNTGVGPNLQITTGVNNQGYLDLNSKTAIEIDPNIVYVFKVYLVAGKMFDLNIRTIAGLNYYIYFEDILTNSGSANGLTRNIFPLVSRATGDYYIYLHSGSYNYVILQPQEIDVNNLATDSPVTRYFVNQPNDIWNESKQTTEVNKAKETIHAYHLSLKKGTYMFKYIAFDTYTTNAYVVVSGSYQETYLVPTYNDIILGSGSVDKFIYHFEEKTDVVIYVDAERDNTDWIEFDYILSVESLDAPVLQAGVQYAYDDTFFYYGVEVEETQIAYFNISAMAPLDLWYFKYTDEGKTYGNYYTLNVDAEYCAKILLEPGYYFFMNPFETSYDLTIEYNAVVAETYAGGNLDFSISEDDGDSSNYKLVKVENSDLSYHNYNITLLSQKNYTVEVGYFLYTGSYDFYRQYNFYTIGNQQNAGVYQGYQVNDMQFVNFMSPGATTTRYLLINILAVYNNTGVTWPTLGSYYSDSPSVSLRFKEDSAVPEDLDSVNINYISASLNEEGGGIVSRNFNTAINDYELYIIQATVPEHIWYNLKITIVNGTRDSTTYYLNNYDGLRDYRLRQHSIWNTYYCLDPFSLTEFVTYDESNITNVNFEVEFGVFDSNLVVMFAVSHIGLNGSITFEFVPHDSTLITETDLGRFPGGGLGLIGSIILGIVGGGLVVAAIVILIVKVIVTKSKGGSSPPPQY